MTRDLFRRSFQDFSDSARQGSRSNDGLREPTNKSQPALVIAEDRQTRELSALILVRAGFSTRTCKDGREGLLELRSFAPEVVIVDLEMTEAEGMVFLDHLATLKPRPLTVVISGFASVTTVIEVFRRGANDFIEKPVSEMQLLSAVGRPTSVSHSARRSELRLDPRVRRVQAIVDCDPSHREELSLEQLAKTVNLSPSYLSRLFSDSVGRGLSAYIRRQRVQSAALLLDRGFSVSDVARKLRYSHLSNLCRDFTSIVGCSASAYQRRRRVQR